MPSTGSTATSHAPVRREQPGELAGAGGDVGHHAAGRDPERVDDPADRVGRVRGTSALVGVGLGAEPGARDLVDAQVAADGVQPCSPHSSLPLLVQRPARGSSPSFTGLVQGQQPIDG